MVAAAYSQESARVKKQVLISDDGSYWPGKYDLRELSPALGALPDGVAVRAALPAAVPAVLPATLPAGIPALAAPYGYPYSYPYLG